MNEYGIVKRQTNEVIHTFNSVNNSDALIKAMDYLKSLGLSVTTIKRDFKVVGFVLNK